MNAVEFRESVGAGQKDFFLDIDLQKFETNQKSWFIQNQDYYWGIFLAEIPYRRLAFLGSPAEFRYTGGSSGGGGGNNPPPCTGVCD